MAKITAGHDSNYETDQPDSLAGLFHSLSGWRDLNSRPLAPQTSTLNRAELHPEICEQKYITLTELQNYYQYKKRYSFCKSNVQIMKYCHKLYEKPGKIASPPGGSQNQYTYYAFMKLNINLEIIK